MDSADFAPVNNVNVQVPVGQFTEFNWSVAQGSAEQSMSQVSTQMPVFAPPPLAEEGLLGLDVKEIFDDVDFVVSQRQTMEAKKDQFNVSRQVCFRD